MKCAVLFILNSLLCVGSYKVWKLCHKTKTLLSCVNKLQSYWHIELRACHFVCLTVVTMCVCVCVCCSLATVSCYHCCTVGRKITTEQSTMPTQLVVSSTRSAMNPVLELLQGHKTGSNIWRNLHFLAKSAFIGKVHFLLTKFNIFGNKILLIPPYLHLATSEMWYWSGGRGILKTLCLYYSVVYYSNGAQRYEQFLQSGQLYRLWSYSVYIYIFFKFLLTLFSLRFNELSLVGLALDLVD